MTYYILCDIIMYYITVSFNLLRQRTQSKLSSLPHPVSFLPQLHNPHSPQMGPWQDKIKHGAMTGRLVYTSEKSNTQHCFLNVRAVNHLLQEDAKEVLWFLNSFHQEQIEYHPQNFAPTQPESMNLIRALAAETLWPLLCRKSDLVS